MGTCTGYEFSAPVTPREVKKSAPKPAVTVTPPQITPKVEEPMTPKVKVELPGFQTPLLAPQNLPGAEPSLPRFKTEPDFQMSVGNLPTMPAPINITELPSFSGNLPGFGVPVSSPYVPKRLKVSEDTYSLTRPVQIRRRARNGGINPRMPRPQATYQTPNGVVGMIPMSQMPDHKVLIHIARDPLS